MAKGGSVREAVKGSKAAREQVYQIENPLYDMNGAAEPDTPEAPTGVTGYIPIGRSPSNKLKIKERIDPRPKSAFHKVRFYYYRRCSPRRLLPVLLILLLVLIGIGIAIYFVVTKTKDDKDADEAFESRSLAAVIRLKDQVYHSTYSQPGAPDRKQFIDDLTKQFDKVFVNTTLEEDFKQSHITDLRSGSVIVEVVFVFIKVRQSEQLVKDVKDAFSLNTRATASFDRHMGDYLIDGRSLTFTAIPLGEETLLTSTSPTAANTTTVHTSTTQAITTTSTSTTMTPTTTTLTTTTTKLATTTTPEICEDVHIPICANTSSTVSIMTSYPNFMNNTDQHTASREVSALTSLLESACHEYSERLICALYAPKCTLTETGPVNIPPCRRLCREFMQTCTAKLSSELSIMDCDSFPDSDDPDVCVGAPRMREVSVRLLGGPTPSEGRVELMWQGVWTAMCDIGWTDVDAKVLCQQLNYTGRAVARDGGYYGQGTTTSWISGINCAGNEAHLALCPLQYPQMACHHGDEAGVVCNVDQRDGSALKVRLVGDSQPNSNRGVIEVLYSQTWGTVCKGGFDIDDAKVVCHMLGYNSSARLIETSLFTNYSRQTWLDHVDCVGLETSLLFCDHKGWGRHDCPPGDAVSIECDTEEVSMVTATTKLQSVTGVSELEIRLVDGDDDLSGRVEVRRGGEWGTICKERFDDEDATVICRSLGFTGAGEYQYARYGEADDSVPIWLSRIMCNGVENHLSECPADWGENSCDHQGDVSISCQHTPIEITTQQQLSSTEILVEATTGVYQTTAVGHVTTILPTDTSYTTVIPESVVRLSDGTADHWGRVEVYHEGQWGTVCKESFDIEDARVVCRSLNYNDSYPALYLGTPLPGTGAIHMGYLECEGTESSLEDCDHEKEHYCDDHADDVTVSCGQYPDVSVRLNGSEGNQGLLEMSIGGIWGTVCTDSFDDNDATVFCRMLGFNGTGEYVRDGTAAGSGVIWLTDIECTGDEHHILDCPYSADTSFCHHAYTDVSIQCRNIVVPDIALRLEGSDQYEGRVQIFHDLSWGTVCDDGFDQLDAQVACNMLHLPGPARVIVTSLFSDDYPIIMSDVDCQGNETSLMHCRHGDWGSHRCAPHEAVSISCRPIEGIRLVDGSHPGEGRLEIQHGGVWGTICSDYFDFKDAMVACRRLGYNDTSYADKSSKKFSPGTDEIWLENLRCTGDEMDLADCRHSGWGVHNCEHRDDVGIKCVPPPTTTTSSTTASTIHTDVESTPVDNTAAVITRHTSTSDNDGVEITTETSPVAVTAVESPSETSPHDAVIITSESSPSDNDTVTLQ